MSTGFERLRVVAAAGLGGAALVPLVAGPALAAQTNLPAFHTGHRTDVASNSFGHFTFYRRTGWKVGNSAFWPTGPSQGYGIQSMGRSTLVACSGSPCFGTGTGDVILGVMPRINGTVFKNPDGTIDVSGPTFNSDPAFVHGVRTQIRHDFFGMDDLGNSITRVLMTFSNTTADPMSRTIQVGATIGHGAANILETSDGDTTYERNDSWLRTGGSAADEQLIAKGDRQLSTIDADPSDNGALIDHYRLRIKPHTTVRLLYYAVMSPPAFWQQRVASIEHHFDDGFQLDAHGLLAGLTAKQRKQIINWSNLPTS
jgi:hypothetical protein